MTDYASFFFSSSSGLVPLKCIEINHPSFAAPFCYVANDYYGVTAGGKFYSYQNMSIQRSSVTNDLDQKMSITLADVDDELVKSTRAIRKSAYPRVAPTFSYKVFREDNLDEPMIEMQTLQIPTVSKDNKGLCTFDAQAPQLNNVGTGEPFDPERFKLLKGY